MPQSPENLPIAMLTGPTPAWAGLTNQTQMGLFTKPPFVTGHNMDGEKTDPINQWLHPYAPSLESSHPRLEGKLINISLGYEVLPLPGPRKIMHKPRSTNLGFRPASKRRLSDTAALSLSVNHVYYWNFRERVRGKNKKHYVKGY